VGEVVISRVPAGVADRVIGMFGRNDKAVLVVGIAAVSLVLAALIGTMAYRRYWVASVGYSLSAAIGVLAGISRSPAAPLATLAVGAGGAGAGLSCLRMLLGLRSGATSDGDVVDSRRQILRVGAAAVAAGLLAAAAGRRLAQRVNLGTDPSDVALSVPATSLAQAGPAMSIGVEGVSPLFTPNRSFYRIDTALIVPRVDIDAWRLRITGLVERPLALSYRQLSEMAQVEADITISCVSNEVGGDLVGAARWQGVPLADLLGQAGVRPGATQVVGRSLDGWTAGFPTALALDGRSALVALGMNGRPLPLGHGFPARLVVPGLYGYVSATKWLTELELTRFDTFQGFWVPRGWAAKAPILTQSRIDVPAFGATIAAGHTPVAGVAWAPDRGITGVEVNIDRAGWVSAKTSTPITKATWVQWLYDWDAAAGSHTIEVRATDGTGEVQTDAHSAPAPDGARGHHTIQVNVT